jgi:F-type H+-transporting ATPase subunit b
LNARRILAAAFLLLFAAAVASAQQSKPSQPSQPASAQPQPGQQASPSQQLVEASKAAEQGKEEDEEAQFKYSAAVQWLAKKTGLSKEAAYWVAVSINFLIVAGFIAWAVKKTAPGMFRDRTALIKRQLEEARAASAEAGRRLTEIESRLLRLDSEIAEIRAAAERDAATEEQRLRAAADADKQRIVTTAEQEIASAAKLARGELKQYAAELAVTLAEQKVQVTPAADQALVRDFVDRLGAEGGKS